MLTHDTAEYSVVSRRKRNLSVWTLGMFSFASIDEQGPNFIIYPKPARVLLYFRTKALVAR